VAAVRGFGVGRRHRGVGELLCHRPGRYYHLLLQAATRGGLDNVRTTTTAEVTLLELPLPCLRRRRLGSSSPSRARAVARSSCFARARGNGVVRGGAVELPAHARGGGRLRGRALPHTPARQLGRAASRVLAASAGVELLTRARDSGDHRGGAASRALVTAAAVSSSSASFSTLSAPHLVL
jgi:hypothetical protein